MDLKELLKKLRAEIKTLADKDELSEEEAKELEAKMAQARKVKIQLEARGELDEPAEVIELTAEEIKALQADAIEQAMKKLPAIVSGVNVEVTLDEADRPFKTLAEQCQAVKYAASPHRTANIDPRLNRLDAVKAAIKATGASEGVSSDGGFLLDPTLVPEVLKPMHEEGPFTRAVRKLPVGTNSNYGWLNGVDETDRATGSRWGGIRGYRLAEAGTLTGSKPKFRRIPWELKKYAVLVYGTEELLADAAQFSEVVRVGAAEELSFMANDDVLNGLGQGGPLGVLASGAVVSVSKETGQAAATIVYENLVKMWARMSTRSKLRAAWYINTDCNPQLDALSISAGTGALEPRFMGYDANGLMRIKGRPVIETEFNATLGTVGDIVLADMQEYLYWERGGVQSASSIHVQFLTDEEVFRFIYRCDGQPSIASPLTPYKGTNTQSPFVSLATRA